MMSKLEIFGANDNDWKEIFPRIEPIFEISKLGKIQNLIYYQYLNGNGMCYSRYNKSLMGKEYIAFAGLIGTWTENTSFF